MYKRIYEMKELSAKVIVANVCTGISKSIVRMVVIKIEWFKLYLSFSFSFSDKKCEKSNLMAYSRKRMRHLCGYIFLW